MEASRRYFFAALLILAYPSSADDAIGTIDIAPDVRVEIRNGRIGREDATRAFRYSTSYLFGTKRDYDATLKALERIRTLYGKELDPDCLLWEAKANFWNHNLTASTDKLFQLTSMYPESGLLSNAMCADLEQMIYAQINGTIPGWRDGGTSNLCGQHLQPMLVRYHLLDKFCQGTAPHSRSTQKISSFLSEKQDLGLKHCNRALVVHVKSNPPQPGWIVNSLKEALSAGVFAQDDILKSIPGFENPDFYRQTANEIVTKGLYSYNYTPCSSDDSFDSGPRQCHTLTWDIPQISLANILMQVDSTPPLLLDILNRNPPTDTSFSFRLATSQYERVATQKIAISRKSPPEELTLELNVKDFNSIQSGKKWVWGGDSDSNAAFASLLVQFPGQPETVVRSFSHSDLATSEQNPILIRLTHPNVDLSITKVTASIHQVPQDVPFQRRMLGILVGLEVSGTLSKR